MRISFSRERSLVILERQYLKQSEKPWVAKGPLTRSLDRLDEKTAGDLDPKASHCGSFEYRFSLPMDITPDSRAHRPSGRW